MQKNVRQLELPPFFSDGVVLQREKTVKIWGRDLPSSSVTVTFKDEVYSTISEEIGDWEIDLGIHSAGGPYIIQIQGSDTFVINDVYIGEVWLAGGQSNMELPINRVYDSFKEEIDEAHYPFIRQFQVPQVYNFMEPQETISEEKWMTAVQENIQDFSALAFFYAKKLYEELNVPVGIIHTAVGGTPAEAWISEETLRKMGGYEDELAFLKQTERVHQIIEEDTRRTEEWYQTLAALDEGLHADMPWYASDLSDNDWDTIELPQMFHETVLENIPGAVWFRKEFYLDETVLEDPELVLWLGTLIDSDDAYVNGVHVGRTDYRYPPRKYRLEKNVLRPGKNVLTVRLEMNNPIGGFIPDNFYGIKGKQVSIPIAGEWRYRIGALMEEPLEPPTFFQYKPAGLYNAMIHPLRKMAIRGFLYYQGESNAKNPGNYAELMEALIADWRNLWGETMPFYFVQLANYLDPAQKVDDQKWAELRHQQALVSQRVENTGMVLAVDAGITNELHPPDKKTLGHRLAHWVLDNIYSIPHTHQNPQLQNVKKEDGHYILRFGPSVENLIVAGDSRPDIELREEGGTWVHAEAHLKNNEVMIYTNQFNKYTVIRYAWRNAPKGILRDEKTSLPVIPFNILLDTLEKNG